MPICQRSFNNENLPVSVLINIRSFILMHCSFSTCELNLKKEIHDTVIGRTCGVLYIASLSSVPSPDEIKSVCS